MLALPLLYHAGVYCHRRSSRASTRAPRPLQAQGFSSARSQNFACHSHTLLTHNHDNDNNTAPDHSACLSLSFAVAASLRRNTPHRRTTMGQCASCLCRRNTAGSASADTPLAWLMELQEFFDWDYTLRALVGQRRTPGYSSDDTSLSLSSAPVSDSRLRTVTQHPLTSVSLTGIRCDNRARIMQQHGQYG